MSLNTRVKRKRELREVYIPQDALIFQLPDETLLAIFKYLTTVELIRAAGYVELVVCFFSSSMNIFADFPRICKWFRNIAYDEEFWTTIDLTCKSCSNRVLSKFFTLFPRECTEVLKISGGLHHSTSGKPPPFAGKLNSQIQAAYPNLRHLHISQYDFHADQTTVDHLTRFSNNFQGIYLTKCDMLATNLPGSVAFFQIPADFSANSSFQQLEILSLENSSCITSESLSSLARLCPKLTELNLNGCYRLIHKSILVETLIFYSQTLRRLGLRATQINDDTIHSICRKLKRLTRFDIKQCRNVTVNIVDNLLTLKQLDKLNANDNIQTLYEQRKLNPSESDP